MASLSEPSTKLLQVLSLSAGKVVTSVASLIIAAVLARKLAPEEYGTYRQAFVIYWFSLPVFLLGLPEALYYFLPGAGQKERSVLAENVLLTSLSGTILAASLYLFIGDYAAGEFSNPRLKMVVPILALLVLFTFPASGASSCLVTKGKFVTAALLGVSGQFIVGVLVITVVSIHPNAHAALRGHAVAAALILPVLLWAMFRSCEGIAAPSFKGMVAQLQYAVPAGLAGVAGTVSMLIDKVLVSSQFAPSEFAEYVNGATELPLVGIVTSSVMAVILPEMSNQCRAGERRAALALWQSAASRTGLVIFPLMCFFFFMAKDFLVVLYSEQYASSAGIFRIYLLMLPLRVVTFGAALMVVGKGRLVLLAALAGLGGNLLGTPLCIRLMGIAGAAVSMVVTTYLIQVALLIGFIMREYQVALWRVLPFCRLGEILLLSLAGLVVCLPFVIVDGVPPLTRLVMTGMAYFSFVVAVYKWRGLLEGIGMRALWGALSRGR